MIANPAAANGRVGRRWDRIHGLIKDNYREPFDVELTRHRGHATELSHEAVAAGYGTVVAVGGDGTFNEVLNGLIGDPPGAPPDIALGLLPMGTGNDLVRTLGVPRAFDRAVQSLNRDETRLIDVGVVRATGPEVLRRSDTS